MRALVLECLSARSGRFRLSVDEQRVARELADGFGPIHPVRDAALLWDWSHVRDSSPGGILRIHEYLRGLGVLA